MPCAGGGKPVVTVAPGAGTYRLSAAGKKASRTA